MFCENCGSPLGEADKFCMKCGYRVSTAAEQSAPTVAEQSAPNAPSEEQAAPSEAGATEVLNQQAAPEASLEEQAMTLEAGATEVLNQQMAPTAAAQMVPNEPYVQAAAAEEVPRKKGFFRRHLGWMITVVVLAVGAVAAVANASAINNFVHKTFSSPEKYYQYVEKKAMEDKTESIAANYQNYLLSNVGKDNQGATASIELELTDEGSDWLSMAGLAGIDLSDLRSGKITLDVDSQDGLTGMRLLAGLNGVDIGALELIMNMDTQYFYAGAPDFNETMLGIDYGAMGADAVDYEEQIEQMRALQEVLPSQKELEKMLNRYMDAMLGCVENVEKESETLEAEGVSQKCTALEVTIDSGLVEDMLKALYEEMEGDDELKQIFVDVAEVMEAEEDGEDLFEEFLDGMKDELDDLEYEMDDEMEIVMTVYVDGKGVVRGRKLEFDSDYDSVELSCIMPRSGSEFGYELSMSAEGVTHTLAGSGKYSGNKINGEFELKSSGARIVELTVKDFDTEKMKKGYPNGSITISPSKQMGALLYGMVPGGEGYATGLPAILSDLQLTLDMETSEKKENIVLSLLYEEEKMVSLTLTSESRKAKDVEEPTDVMEMEDEMDFAKWLEDFDWDELIDRLEDADLPSVLLNALKEAVQ